MYSAPGDYLSTAVNITFSPGGENRMCVNITVNEDQVIENPENFTVILERNIPGGALQVLDQSEVRVLDSNGRFIVIPSMLVHKPESNYIGNYLIFY